MIIDNGTIFSNKITGYVKPFGMGPLNIEGQVSTAVFCLAEMGIMFFIATTASRGEQAENNNVSKWTRCISLLNGMDPL